MLRRAWIVTSAQDDALNQRAAHLGISKNELVRRVLDEWRERFDEKKGTP